MGRRIRAALVVGATLVAGTASLPAMAGAPPIPTVAAGDPAVMAMVAERGVPVFHARQAVAAQVRAGELVEPLAASLGSAFGGLWIGDDDRIKIGVTDRAAHGIAAAQGVEGWTDTVPVRFGLAELESASDWLGRQVVRVNGRSRDAAPLMSALDLRENAVELRLPASGKLTAAQQELLATAKARLGEMLQVTSTARPATANACSLTECDPPLRGGIALRGPGACSTGFLARGRDAGNRYVITAGHCGTTGQTWSLRADGATRTIGRMTDRRFSSGGDAAIIHVSDTRYWNPRPIVYVAASGDTTLNKRYEITSDGTSVQGMRICTTGATTGTRCGRVTSLDVSVTYSGTGVTVRNMGEANLCMTRGDSGGPFYSGHTAYGLDGASTCSGGQGHTYYQGIRAAENFLNVDVLLG